MFDAEKLLGQMLGGALGSSLGGKRRKRKGGGSIFGTAMRNPQATLGLIGLAMAAYEHYTAKPAAVPGPSVAPLPATPPPPPPGAGSAIPPPPPPAKRDDVLLLIRAMVAAAAADGAIDAIEREAIEQRAKAANLDENAREFLRGCIATPPTAAQLAAATPPALARDVYLACAVTITPDTAVEKLFLDELATKLGIDAQTREGLDAEIAAIE